MSCGATACSTTSCGSFTAVRGPSTRSARRFERPTVHSPTKNYVALCEGSAPSSPPRESGARSRPTLRCVRSCKSPFTSGSANLDGWYAAWPNLRSPFAPMTRTIPRPAPTSHLRKGIECPTITAFAIRMTSRPRTGLGSISHSSSAGSAGSPDGQQTLNSASTRVDQDLRKIYNAYFANDVGLRFLFPESGSAHASGGKDCSVCGACGSFRLGHHTGACGECSSQVVIQLHTPDSVAARTVGEGRDRRQISELSRDCPYCLAEDSIFIFGARSTALLSIVIAQIYASRHNQDRKVIAFSDNVQDAAHRAGFHFASYLADHKACRDHPGCRWRFASFA